MKNANLKIDLTGRWMVTRFYIRREQEKGTFEVLPADGYGWEFSPHGVLTEINEGKGTIRSTYSFSPADKNLRIVHGDFAENNPTRTRPEDIYRIVPVGDELYLYDFEEGDPAAFVFRQVILRRPQ